MIATALLFLQVATASPQVGPPAPAPPAAVDTTVPRVLVVHDAARSLRVPVVDGESGPVVRIDQLAPVVPVSVSRDSAGGFALTVGGVVLRIQAGIPAVRVGDDAYVMPGAPESRDGRLYVPLAFATGMLPQLVPNLRWDDGQRQLVAFSKIASATPTAPAPTASRPVRSRVAPESPRQATIDAAAAAVHRAPGKREQRIVVVDAGHGGPDNGMTGPLGGPTTLYEKNVTLAVAKKLGAALQRRGVSVVYTRTTDTLIALSDRGAIANKAGGDLFISIHVNAANPNWRDPGGSRGFETYFLSEARTEDARRVEKMENDAVRYEGAPVADRDDPLSFILSDMMQNEHLRESSELADVIQNRLKTMHPGPSRGVKQAGFRVLVTAYMPAVLVEIGFGTNPQEAAFLMDPAKQQRIADAIAQAAVEYLRGYERRVGGTW